MILIYAHKSNLLIAPTWVIRLSWIYVSCLWASVRPSSSSFSYFCLYVRYNSLRSASNELYHFRASLHRPQHCKPPCVDPSDLSGNLFRSRMQTNNGYTFLLAFLHYCNYDIRFLLCLGLFEEWWPGVSHHLHLVYNTSLVNLYPPFCSSPSRATHQDLNW